MSRINILDKNTINQIAAGEVIDRPASIIKELVENSIDAGATSISVEIRGGGIDLIRITDNGSGIDKDDVKVAFIRHTTSKIKDAGDLSHITSLGFRGEALASIAAVADVELITKTKEAFSAVHYRIKGGEEVLFEEIGAPDGTTFIIRDVFLQVPVRRKFLKSSATEGSYCNEAVERIALSHPEVSIKYVNNGRNVLFTNGSGKMKDVLFGIYGRDIASEIIELDYTGVKNIKVSGCICRPAVVRSNRNTENYFVNGRFIRSQILFKAIEDAYQPFLMQHKYPFTDIFIDIDPASMDVNVHPSKQEVRFENPEAVYNTVFTAVSDALAGKALIHRAEPEVSNKKEEKKENARYIPEPYEVKKKIEEKITVRPEIKNSSFVVDNKNLPDKISDISTACVSSISGKNVGYKTEEDGNKISFAAEPEAEFKTTRKTTEETDTKAGTKYSIEQSQNNTAVEKESIPESKGTYTQPTLFDGPDKHLETRTEFNNVFSRGYRIVGQIFATYWIIECDGCVYMIDQHAAHEKILYEKFMENVGKDEATQLLSPPMIISLSSTEEAAAEKYKDVLAQNGFVLEHFGGHEYALSEIPLNLYGIDPKNMLLELLEELMKDIKGNVIKSIKEKIATCACKAAVKGNTDMTQEEAVQLIADLLKLENPFNCPHGRPVIIDMTKREVEKKFKRIV
ncbi:MAG: DNA mismatch repair endonuclease MutL [Lachnospiraceae bacterium]|nr:DNA mismatch repair endonuclease MutL [Lachnospiraceae bacterium]